MRKIFGHGHIPQRWASLINDFNRQHLNPYINYHRPCLFPVIITDSKGKQRKRYPYQSLMTPYEKLKSLPLASAKVERLIGERMPMWYSLADCAERQASISRRLSR